MSNSDGRYFSYAEAKKVVRRMRKDLYVRDGYEVVIVAWAWNTNGYSRDGQYPVTGYAVRAYRTGYFGFATADCWQMVPYVIRQAKKYTTLL